jgi:hypothetical protein
MKTKKNISSELKNESENKEGKIEEEENFTIGKEKIDKIINEVSEIDFLTPEKIAEKKVSEIKETKEERTPKSNRKTSKALEAEEKEKLLGVTRSFINGLNEVLVNRLGEDFRHEKEELDTYSVLVFAVLNKHFPDIIGSEYKEEIALAMYAFGTETPKIMSYIEKRKKRNNEK